MRSRAEEFAAAQHSAESAMEVSELSQVDAYLSDAEDGEVAINTRANSMLRPSSTDVTRDEDLNARDESRSISKLKSAGPSLAEDIQNLTDITRKLGGSNSSGRTQNRRDMFRKRMEKGKAVSFAFDDSDAAPASEAEYSMDIKEMSDLIEKQESIMRRLRDRGRTVVRDGDTLVVVPLHAAGGNTSSVGASFLSGASAGEVAGTSYEARKARSLSVGSHHHGHAAGLSTPDRSALFARIGTPGTPGAGASASVLATAAAASATGATAAAASSSSASAAGAGNAAGSTPGQKPSDPLSLSLDDEFRLGEQQQEGGMGGSAADAGPPRTPFKFITSERLQSSAIKKQPPFTPFIGEESFMFLRSPGVQGQRAAMGANVQPPTGAGSARKPFRFLSRGKSLAGELEAQGRYRLEPLPLRKDSKDDLEGEGPRNHKDKGKGKEADDKMAPESAAPAPVFAFPGSDQNQQQQQPGQPNAQQLWIPAWTLPTNFVPFPMTWYS
jgi:hypothetical protein